MATSRLTLQSAPLATLAALLLAAVLLIPLGGCVTAAQAEAGLDTASSAMSGAVSAGEAVADKLYAAEVRLICRKSIRAHTEAIGAGIMSAKALPLMCPEVDAFASTIQGAR